MTMNKMIVLLSRASVDYLLAGEIEKSNACLTLIDLINEKGFKNVKGKLPVDIL